MNKKIKIILIVIFILVFAFLRENFFKNINAQINSLSDSDSNFQISYWLTFLTPLSSPALLKIKWIATFVFALLFLLFTVIILRIWIGKNEYKYLPHLIFLGVFLLSGIAMLIGKIIPSVYSSAYYFSRWLMGSAQSPLLPGIICVFVYYTQKLNQKKIN